MIARAYNQQTTLEVSAWKAMRLSLVGACLLMVLPGCLAFTENYQDGFRNIQVTVIPGSWNRPGQTFVTTCQIKQMVMDSAGKYYCPPDNTVAGLHPHYELPYQTASVKDLVIPAAISGAALLGTGGMIMHGLQNIPASKITQSAFPDARVSTLNLFDQAPAGFVR